MKMDTTCAEPTRAHVGSLGIKSVKISAQDVTLVCHCKPKQRIMRREESPESDQIPETDRQTDSARAETETETDGMSEAN